MEKDNQQSRQTRRNKVRVVSARFTDIEYQAVEKRRKDAGVSLSRFVHSVLLTGKVVQRISKADADVLRKLAGEANNINQLAHKANAGGFAGVAAELMMLNWKDTTKIENSDRKKILDHIDNLMKKRVEAIMGANRRNYYGECAAYIAAIGEVKEKLGEKNAKQIYMSHYADMYTRRSAFKSELKSYGWIKR